MNRIEVIQKILDKKKEPAYLEIGVDLGNTFFPIKARQKIAVDPYFKFSKKEKKEWVRKNPYNKAAKYYKLTSDRYFAKTKKFCQIDVVFIDGYHSYQQALKDVDNSLSNLKENGVIVMHDCDPPNEATAYPAESFKHAASLNLPGWNGRWCGDVWKAVLYLRSNREDLKIFVLDCDYGIGIIKKGEPDNCLNLSEQDIDKMTYDEFSQNREKLLNLKGKIFLFKFLKTI
ncbi:class I SAM-dependent methyltransferase [Thermodesulfobacteriota bacterium]